MKRALRRIGIIFLFVAPLLVSTPVNAITEAQKRALDGGAIYTNTEETYCGTSTSSSQNILIGKKVFFIGDSLTVGTTQNGLLDIVSKEGISVDTNYQTDGTRLFGRVFGKSVEATSGNKIADAINDLRGHEQDFATGAADMIVVGLGSNRESNLDSAVKTMIDYLRGVNTSLTDSKSIMWVNTNVTSTDFQPPTATVNSELAAAAAKYNFTVLDIASITSANPDDGYGVHYTDAGYIARSKTIIDLMKKAHGVNANLSADVIKTSGYDANEKMAWDFFRTKMSLSENATAGIMGNLLRENGGRMDPESLSGVGDVPFMPVESDGITPELSVYGKKGYGLAQWTTKSRQLNFVNFSLGKGPAPFNTPRRNGDMQYQLDYIKYELESGYFKPSYDVITNPSVSLKDAAEIINLNYETPRSVIEPKRSDYPSDAEYKTAYDRWLVSKPESLATSVNFANAMLFKFAGRTESTTAQDDCDNNGPSRDSTVTGSGINLLVGGVRYFSQCDPAWKTINYGDPGDTICSSGCGPTATAMIISTLKNDPSITPQVIAEWGANNGMIYYENGESTGSKTAIAPRAAAAWGLNTRVMNKSLSAVQQVFNDGGYVFINVGPGDFTDGGHFIILRGFDSSGKLLVSDPNDGQPGQGRYLKKTQVAWDFDQVMSQTKGIVGILP